MVKKEKEELLINAIAVYICFYSKKNNIFLPDVDIRSISELMGANYTIQDKARNRARSLIFSII